MKELRAETSARSSGRDVGFKSGTGVVISEPDTNVVITAPPTGVAISKPESLSSIPGTIVVAIEPGRDVVRNEPETDVVTNAPGKEVVMTESAILMTGNSGISVLTTEPGREVTASDPDIDLVTTAPGSEVVIIEPRIPTRNSGIVVVMMSPGMDIVLAELETVATTSAPEIAVAIREPGSGGVTKIPPTAVLLTSELGAGTELTDLIEGKMYLPFRDPRTEAATTASEMAVVTNKAASPGLEVVTRVSGTESTTGLKGTDVTIDSFGLLPSPLASSLPNTSVAEASARPRLRLSVGEGNENFGKLAAGVGLICVCRSCGLSLGLDKVIPASTFNQVLSEVGRIIMIFPSGSDMEVASLCKLSLFGGASSETTSDVSPTATSGLSRLTLA